MFHYISQNGLILKVLKSNGKQLNFKLENFSYRTDVHMHE